MIHIRMNNITMATPYNISNDTRVNDTLLSRNINRNFTGGGGMQFFDTYFSAPRFAVETILATLATLCNVVSLTAIRNARCHSNRSVYGTLFVNIAIANVLSCMLSWLCNNVLFLFRQQLRSATNMCGVLVSMSAGAFVTSAFGIVSTLTMLGFTTVQYFAICNPLHHQSILRMRNIRIFIGTSWFVCLLGSCAPFVSLVAITHNQPCNTATLDIILALVHYGVNTCASIGAITYVIIVVLCARIYCEIRRLRKRISRFRYDQRDVQSERKAFITIVILLSTLTIFVVPYTVICVLSINSPSDEGVSSEAVIYYMNLLPYFKFLSDPLIYGLRMREVKDGCRRLAARCGLGWCIKGDASFSRGPSTASYTLHHMQSSMSITVQQ